MSVVDSNLILCRLLGAWIHKTAPAAEISDFEALFQAANRHLLSAAACAALEETGLMARCPPETAQRFRTAKLQSVRKTVLMDAERGALLALLDERGIRHALLKGAILNDCYPSHGARQCSDNDILFDAARWREVRSLMKTRGYRAEGVGKGVHDTYHKPPVYSFELHRELFKDDYRGGLLSACASYYADVWERLVRDGDGCGYRFGDEDFYIYFIAHACKHFQDAGTGLRTPLDAYLYRRARPEMDGAYIAEELGKLGLTEFESTLRALAKKLFGAPCMPALTEAEREMFASLESSGVYGTVEHRVDGELRRLQGGAEPIDGRTRARYLLRRVFPDREWYRANAPFVHRHPWITPLFWLYRLGRGVFVNGRMNLKMLAAAIRKRQAAGEEPRH